MRKSSYVLGLLMAGLLVVGGSGFSQADDLVVSGFGDIIYTVTEEGADVTGSTNPKEDKFGADGEIDFVRKQGNVTFRLDLDILLGAGDTELEQVKFDWAIPLGAPVDINLTGGVFNSNITFEAIDAPDLLQVSHGQIFGLVPQILAGVELAASQGPVTASFIFANEVRGENEENTIGLKVSFTPMPIVGLKVGYLTGEKTAAVPATTAVPGDPGTAATPANLNEDVLDIVLTGTVPAGAVDLTYAVEYLTDEIHDALGLTAHAAHGHHGLTVRYDTVETDGTSAEPTSLTVAASAELDDNLAVLLEWRTDDSDVTGSDDEDTVLVEFVVTF